MPGMSGIRTAAVAALAVTFAAVWAGSPAHAAVSGERSPLSHVVVGVTPSVSFDVALDGEALPGSPMVSDSLGILGYEIAAGDLPPGSHTVWFGPAGEPPPPELTVHSVVVDSVTQASAVVSWRTNLPSDSRVDFGHDATYGNSSGTDPALVVEHSMRLSGLDPGSTYHFRVISEDATGQTASSEDAQFETAEPPPPPPPPLEVVNVEVVAVDTTWAVVGWSTNLPATSAVEYGPDAAYGAVSGTDSSLVVEHSMTLPGLEPGSTYHFRVISEDATGQSASSEDAQFETAEPPPPPPPPPPPLEIAGVEVEDVGPSWAVISWSTNRPASSQVRFGLTDTLGWSTPEDTLDVLEHTVMLAGLEDGTLYHFCVCSADTGGTTAVSADSTFTTLEVEVTGPPVITDVCVELIRVNAVVVTWTTDRPATSQVGYGTKGEVDRHSALYEGPTTDHAVYIKPVAPRHEYTFIAMSACGRDTSRAGPYTFTASTQDGEPTTARPVTVARASVLSLGETSARVGWVTDRPCSTRVEYGSDGMFEHTATASCVSECVYEADMADLEPGTFYVYRIRAWDGTGGSTVSEAGAFETEAGPDGDAPGSWSGSVSLAIHPNPSFGHATLAYSAPPGTGVRARIYSSAGGLVRELVDTSRATGSSAIEWDGRDSAGRAVRSGVYFCELTSGGAVVRRKLTVLR